MKRSKLKWAAICACGLLCSAGVQTVVAKDTAIEKIDWPTFMAKQDMHFKKVPRGWTEGPHFGNAMIGSLFFVQGNDLIMQVFRADVHDHRDADQGWPAYSRPRLRIGYFKMKTAGKITEVNWRKDLWNAELTGTITTDRGTIEMSHFTHSNDMAIVTQLKPSVGEKALAWSWHAYPAATTRGKGPGNKAAFAKLYGGFYMETLKPYFSNPVGTLEKEGDLSVWVQNFKVGGQYATAWAQKIDKETYTHIVSIAHSYPSMDAKKQALDVVKNAFEKMKGKTWKQEHRNWWHKYYKRSYINTPDPKVTAFYWQTIYRYGCTSRPGRSFVDTAGLWFQGGGWCYTTTDWNIQAAHWGVCAANRIDQGIELLNQFHKYKKNLIDAVRPVAWQKDSAYLPIEVSGDMWGHRYQDQRYIQCVGNLPWALHNCWMMYRFSMDDEMLRTKLYPLLRRSINMYIHMLVVGKDGKLHLEPTYSPEIKIVNDCNYDLALLKWGCHTLLKASTRLDIKDPLIPKWKEIIARTIDFPSEGGEFAVGSNRLFDGRHRHLSHLLMIYPLHLVNIDQPERKQIIHTSVARANRVPGLPAMVQTHAGPMSAHAGLGGNKVLVGLKRLIADTHPNGLWYPSPCIESTLGGANILQEMLLQSWSDPTKDESGPIRIFPACPDSWKELSFHQLRTEGAFLVSAERKGGKTQWIRIKSLAGEPCRIKPNMNGKIKLSGKRSSKLKELSPGSGIYQISLKKGEEVILTAQ